MELDPDVAWDYAFGLVGGGIPGALYLSLAIRNEDSAQIWYWTKMEAAVLGTQYGMLRFLNWFSPKNAISFHQLKNGMAHFRSVALTKVAPVAIAAGSAYAQRETWKKIGDVKTGAVHYSGSGTMSGGSMPVIGELPTWRDVERWWEENF